MTFDPQSLFLVPFVNDASSGIHREALSVTPQREREGGVERKKEREGERDRKKERKKEREREGKTEREREGQREEEGERGGDVIKQRFQVITN